MKKVAIGRICAGGQIRSQPTIFIGTLFVENVGPLYGNNQFLFDEQAARRCINQETDHCAQFELPVIIDYFFNNQDAAKKQIAFLADQTDFPFMISGSSVDERLAGLQTASQLETLDRAIYQSIGIHTTNEEIQEITRHLPAAIVVDVEGLKRLDMDEASGVLDRVKSHLPVELHSRVLIRLPFSEHFSSLTLCTVGQQLRQKTGHPIIGSPYAAVTAHQENGAMQQQTYLASLAAAVGFFTAYGFDFLFVGPLRHLRHLAGAQCVPDFLRGRNEPKPKRG